MNNYSSPEIEIIALNQDIITTSGGWGVYDGWDVVEDTDIRI